MQNLPSSLVKPDLYFFKNGHLAVGDVLSLDFAIRFLSGLLRALYASAGIAGFFITFLTAEVQLLVPQLYELPTGTASPAIPKNKLGQKAH